MPQASSNVGARPLTVCHVTHESIDQMGGIGTVLEGLMTAPVYRARCPRNIFVGPLPYPDARPARAIERLGHFATECYYSGLDHHDPHGFGAILKPIEWAFGTRMVYGQRRFRDLGPDRCADPVEVLLIDVSNPERERLAAFKWFLWEKFHVDSQRYESGWDYEEYCRLAEPAYHALSALLKGEPGPAVLISHEYMGMCTALRCLADRQRFRTVFHAHECSTARRIVESLPGHDVAFYPAMRAAHAKSRYVAEIFGDQSDFARHALVAKTHLLDQVLAVGPETAEELRFLSPEMNTSKVRVAYNGLPAPKVDLKAKQHSRDLVNTWLKHLLGRVPDYLITHVTRPVISKGLWRDQKLISHLGRELRKAGKTGAYILLTCGANPRSYKDVCTMGYEYGWPKVHRLGYPDLDGPEVGIFKCIEDYRSRFGANVSSIEPIMLNQFGFDREKLGEGAPREITWDDLRRATDVELGMSTYEPFGIAPLEPLHAGAICVVSTISGCCGLVTRAQQELGLNDASCPVVLRADFTKHDGPSDAHMSASERDHVEERVCQALAHELFTRLPRSDADRVKYIDLGQKLASKMSWDRVSTTDILPGLEAAAANHA